VLVPSDDMEDIPKWQRDYLIDKCWVQNSWSASINPKGAFFCEVAAALAMLLEVENIAWPVEPMWWARSPQHFGIQMSLCQLCGCAMPLKRRVSTEQIDDIAPNMYEILKDISPKLKKGLYKIHDCKINEEPEGEIATYKNQVYRDKIAANYGLFLMQSDKKFLEPFLIKNWKGVLDGKT
jgi:hypothetical protein